MRTYCIELDDENATLALGKALAGKIIERQPRMIVVYLQGNLGMGKTTLSRGFLSAFGYHGKVKSPTYTLVEPYQLEEIDLYHFDLYRLGNPEELEFIGIRDYLDTPGADQKPSMCLVEWPEKGCGYLSDPDISVELMPKGQGREARIVVANESYAAGIEGCLEQLAVYTKSGGTSD